MFWRLPFREWREMKGEKNRRAFRRIVKSGPAPGILGYAGREPVAWCCVGPRADFPVLERHPVFARYGDEPSWTIVCLYIARGWRKQGVSVQCLKAAAAFARKHGARLIEGYPVEPKKRSADAFLWTGIASAFRRAGFRKVHAWTPGRPLMRRRLR
jgi:GNAT superfamily N-acetyltransferase